MPITTWQETMVAKKNKIYNWFSGTNQDAAIVTTNEKCLEQQHTQNLF